MIIQFIDISEEAKLPEDSTTNRIPNIGEVMCFITDDNNERIRYYYEVLYICDTRWASGGRGKKLESMKIDGYCLYVVTKKINPKKEKGGIWKSMKEIITRKSKISDLLK